tara:strand:+ start:176 stop:376 length:201 start_codon:yes stop_codon:yes gene_type:complete
MTAGWLSIYLARPTISSGFDGPIRNDSSESNLYSKRPKSKMKVEIITHFQFKRNLIAGDSTGQTDM